MPQKSSQNLQQGHDYEDGCNGGVRVTYANHGYGASTDYTSMTALINHNKKVTRVTRKKRETVRFCTEEDNLSVTREEQVTRRSVKPTDFALRRTFLKCHKNLVKTFNKVTTMRTAAMAVSE